mgnify:CR=1 FL=1
MPLRTGHFSLNIYIHSEGMTILLSSRILPESEQIADKIGFIVDGIVEHEVNPVEIKKNYPKGLEDSFMQIVNG